MDNILNMQYYPTNNHVDAAMHSSPLRKRRCLNKEVISFLYLLLCWNSGNVGLNVRLFAVGR